MSVLTGTSQALQAQQHPAFPFGAPGPSPLAAGATAAPEDMDVSNDANGAAGQNATTNWSAPNPQDHTMTDEDNLIDYSDDEMMDGQAVTDAADSGNNPADSTWTTHHPSAGHDEDLIDYDHDTAAVSTEAHASAPADDLDLIDYSDDESPATAPPQPHDSDLIDYSDDEGPVTAPAHSHANHESDLVDHIDGEATPKAGQQLNPSAADDADLIDYSDDDQPSGAATTTQSLNVQEHASAKELEDASKTPEAPDYHEESGDRASPSAEIHGNFRDGTVEPEEVFDNDANDTYFDNGEYEEADASYEQEPGLSDDASEATQPEFLNPRCEVVIAFDPQVFGDESDLHLFPTIRGGIQYDGLLQDHKLFKKPLRYLLQACADVKLVDSENQFQMVLKFEDLGLEIKQDDSAATSCCLENIVDLFCQLQDNEGRGGPCTMVATMTTCDRFYHHFDQLRIACKDGISYRDFRAHNLPTPPFDPLAGRPCGMDDSDYEDDFASNYDDDEDWGDDGEAYDDDDADGGKDELASEVAQDGSLRSPEGREQLGDTHDDQTASTTEAQQDVVQSTVAEPANVPASNDDSVVETRAAYEAPAATAGGDHAELGRLEGTSPQSLAQKLADEDSTVTQSATSLNGSESSNSRKRSFVDLARDDSSNTSSDLPSDAKRQRAT